MFPTESFKALRHRFGFSISELRNISRDLNLKVAYSKGTHTWYLYEDAHTIALFNDHLANLVLRYE